MSTRTTVLWVPDWPVVAAATAEGTPPHVPTAVHDGRQLTAVSALARAEGVRRGMRRRQAQGVCPELVLLPADDARDVRLFEPVAVAAETVVAGIEVVRAGLLLLPAGGASRYHGSEDALAEKLIDAVAAGSGHECAVGTADGLLAAVLAARTGAVVPAGTSAAYLAPRAMGELLHAAVTDEAASAVAQLVELLHRLGLRQLGHLAALPATDVQARFGRLGAWAQLLARGDDERPPARRRPEADLEVAADLDPPLDRVDTATFAGRRLAEELHALLVQHAVTCGRLQISARTDEGTDLVRTWRTDLGGWGGLTPARITDRIRWQLEGWLASGAVETARARAADDPAARSRARSARHAVASGKDPWAHDDLPVDPWPDESRAVTLVHLAVTALDVAPAGAEQGRLWGGPSGGDLRAHRALDRVQGIVGGSGILVATLQGGRDVRDQVHLQPWGEQAEPARPVDRPWPGRLPDPAPATVLDPPERVDVRDATGAPVVLDVRSGMSGEPAWVRWLPQASDEDRAERAHERGDERRRGQGRRRRAEAWDVAVERLRTADDGPRAVAGWAGPWLLSERWWVAAADRPGLRAHLQVTFDDGRAVLLACTASGWTCEATYD
ncbi:DNA polymerase Y family protein [Cellulomonas fengjieae]|uniref:DNA polymerase Y family protein n=1 Tax=Cellulomonas fengjieae TaxID=2819978 RepID=A0ABS3SJE8_9CELL|nr:DNA polymerase Y family protein [Cellulomonas fengjieae]MBO3085873.1 DNA polymerase Y family protein [Cellulomonas fengjieae]QVI67432.1 DNA polymerase Y family protein [Cellulomonas fengjieae]